MDEKDDGVKPLLLSKEMTTDLRDNDQHQGGKKVGQSVAQKLISHFNGNEPGFNTKKRHCNRKIKSKHCYFYANDRS